MDEASTPTQKSQRHGFSATSTVARQYDPKTGKHSNIADSDSLYQSSLGLLSFINNESRIEDKDSVMEDLDRKRSLANNALARANQVCAIPSKFFHTEMPSQTMNRTADESTISESDLLKTTPQNMSTPKCSKTESKPRLSLFSESISQLSEMLDQNSIDSVMQDFLKISKDNTQATFLPAEAAASKLMADELSWMKKNEMPVTNLNPNLDEIQNLSSVSVGEFFKAKSNSISDFKDTSPSEHKPVPLIDLSQGPSNMELLAETDLLQEINKLPEEKSMSISTIQKILAQDSPLSAINKLTYKKFGSQESNTQPTKLTVPANTSLFGTKTTNLETLENNSTKLSKCQEKLSLLPSTNSSYSTVFTENHAINAMSSSDKENRPDSELSGKQTNASHELPFSRSSSCLTSLSHGKLPIQSTKGELVWGCVKIDKCITKEFLLKNTSSKNIRLQCSLSTYNYKIRKENRSDAECLSTCKFVLHGNESRPFYVSFAPTKIGAAIDELTFTPIDSNLVQTKKQFIRLFGYGGYASAEFQNPMRDNTGKMWLSFGKIDNTLTMPKSISVKNTGNISLFVYVKIQPKYSLTSNSFTMSRNTFVLIPGEERAIELSYTPNAKDIKVLKQALNAIEVTDVGKLEIVSGAEVNRARMRRLCRKCLEKGIHLDNLSQTLSEKIPGEIIPSEIVRFQETCGALTDILETFQYHEVILTVEQDPNQTLIGDFTENSSNFQSLCGDETALADITKVSPKTTHLEPLTIIFAPPHKTEDSLYLSSDAAEAIGYEVTVSPSGLEVFPNKGVILPGEMEVIRIKCGNNLHGKKFKVYVSVESEVHEVDIKVLNVRSSTNFLD